MMVDYFLAIDGIPGESVALDFERQIDVLNWSWSQELDLAGRKESEEIPRLMVGPFRVVKAVDKATPKLMLACASRQIISRAVFTCRRAGELRSDLLRVTLTDLHISSYGVGTRGGSEELPSEEIAIAFTRIEFETTELRDDGSVAGVIRSGWDVRSDESC